MEIREALEITEAAPDVVDFVTKDINEVAALEWAIGAAHIYAKQYQATQPPNTGDAVKDEAAILIAQGAAQQLNLIAKVLAPILEKAKQD